MLIRQHTSFEKFYYPLTDTVALFTAPCALVILYTHVRAHCYNNMRSTEYVIIIYYNTYIIYIYIYSIRLVHEKLHFRQRRFCRHPTLRIIKLRGKYVFVQTAT